MPIKSVPRVRSCSGCRKRARACCSAESDDVDMHHQLMVWGGGPNSIGKKQARSKECTPHTISIDTSGHVHTYMLTRGMRTLPGSVIEHVLFSIVSKWLIAFVVRGSAKILPVGYAICSRRGPPSLLGVNVCLDGAPAPFF